MKFKNITRYLLMIALLAFACQPVFGHAANVTLNRKKLVLGTDETYTLKLKNIKNEKKIKWSSSDRSVVTVKKGVVTAKKVGTATITARYNKRTYTCRVITADFSDMTKKQTHIVKYALKHVGNPYRYGGTSLSRGTDCSGFTMSVYKKAGYSLPHNAYAQLAGTKRVKADKKHLKAGDLIFYGRSKRGCSHVALYIGNGKVVHASNPTNGILVSKYNYRHIVGAGRILK